MKHKNINIRERVYSVTAIISLGVLFADDLF